MMHISGNNRRTIGAREARLTKARQEAEATGRKWMFLIVWDRSLSKSAANPLCASQRLPVKVARLWVPFKVPFKAASQGCHSPSRPSGPLPGVSSFFFALQLKRISL